jgi:aminoglycoside phosphotransferase (APT) family kinase protein
VSHEGLITMGLPTRAEVVERYAERTGIDCDASVWYEAFAQWKTGVVIQQLHNRWVRGESTDPRMATIADRLPVLAHKASELLDQLG